LVYIFDLLLGYLLNTSK